MDRLYYNRSAALFKVISSQLSYFFGFNKKNFNKNQLYAILEKQKNKGEAFAAPAHRGGAATAGMIGGKTMLQLKGVSVTARDENGNVDILRDIDLTLEIKKSMS
jgi:hypothetical protein